MSNLIKWQLTTIVPAIRKMGSVIVGIFFKIVSMKCANVSIMLSCHSHTQVTLIHLGVKRRVKQKGSRKGEMKG